MDKYQKAMQSKAMLLIERYAAEQENPEQTTQMLMGVFNSGFETAKAYYQGDSQRAVEASAEHVAACGRKGRNGASKGRIAGNVFSIDRSK